MFLSIEPVNLPFLEDLSGAGGILILQGRRFLRNPFYVMTSKKHIGGIKIFVVSPPKGLGFSLFAGLDLLPHFPHACLCPLRIRTDIRIPLFISPNRLHFQHLKKIRVGGNPPFSLSRPCVRAVPRSSRCRTGSPPWRNRSRSGSFRSPRRTGSFPCRPCRSSDPHQRHRS